jgi:mannosyltransferase OCH1-like enzyme
MRLSMLRAWSPLKVWQGLQASSSLPMLLFALGSRSAAGSELTPPATHSSTATRSVDRDRRTEPRVDVSSAGIPKVVFQTWKTRDKLPARFATWSRSFKAHNPEFDCMLWDDRDNLEFIAERFSWFLPIYESYPKEIYRADAVRYFFLYEFGGLYVDLDTECLKPLDPMRGWGDVVLGRMGLNSRFEHSIPNAIMASRPRHLLWLLVITIMMERAKKCRTSEAMSACGPESLTGPILLKNAVDFYLTSEEATVRARAGRVIAMMSDAGRPPLHTRNLTILPPEVWFPINWDNPFHRLFRRALTTKRIMLDQTEKARLFPGSYLVTYWSHSW